MTAAEALSLTKQRLSVAGIESASLEAVFLLRHLLGVSSAKLYADPQRALTEDERARLYNMLQRRLTREPLAYILNDCGFYGHDFYVDRRVLIPRPETELLVDQAIECARYCPGDHIAIADIGTGSGAIAISLAHALSRAQVYATDISRDALAVAELNVSCHGMAQRILLLQGNLAEPLPQPVDILVANLPYVCSAELPTLAPEIAHFEPRLALSGGPDGLEPTRMLASQLPAKLAQYGYVLLEVGKGQAEAVCGVVAAHLPTADLWTVVDPAGTARVVRGVLRS
jgi:release factor glutamine methyltransferase